MISGTVSVPTPRIILAAGKGGVGKSTVAAATAAACADRGMRALVMSIDSAHNLSDLFDLRLGHHPTPIAERLFGLEVDINRELSENWGAVTDFFRTMTANNPLVSDLVAEECAVLPGMEDVFGLMRLQTAADTGDFNVIVVDAPPTGDLLKFLRLPEVLRWFMERYRPFERGILQRARPIAEALNWPVPPDDTAAEMEQWYTRVSQANATLSDHSRVSVRLVMTPDRVGLLETQRAFTWTCLLGMNVDGVVVNKLLPEAQYPQVFADWPCRQGEVLGEAQAMFADLPVLRAELQPREVLGHEALRDFGHRLYGDRDPAGLWSESPSIQWTEQRGGAVLRLRLPFLRKGAFRLLASDEGLTLHVDNQRRSLPLPPAVHRRPMLGARYENGWLHVEYGEDTHRVR